MDFFQVGSHQAAVTNHDSTGYPDVAYPVIIEHNEISGTARSQRGQLQIESFGSEPNTAASPGLDDGLRFAVLGSLGSQGPQFVLHAGRVAVGSDRHPITLTEGRWVANAVAPIRARILHDPQVAGGDGSNLRRLTVNAVGQDRTGRQGTEVVQTLERSVEAPLDRIVDVGQVLGHVNVHHGLELPAQVCGRFERLVGDGERGVQPDDSSNQLPLVGSTESATLLETSPSLRMTAIALGRPETEKSSHAELLAGVGQDVQRAFDEIGGFVVVDQGRGAREQCLGYVVSGRGAQGVFVESPIEPPPDALQDLEEVLGRLLWLGHAEGRKPAIDVRVGVDSAWLDSSRRAVQSWPFAPPHPSLGIEAGYAVAFGHEDLAIQIGPQGERSVRRHVGFPRILPTDMARAAGESFMGRR